MAVALREIKERAERIADTVEAKLLTIIKEKLEDPEELKRIEGLGMIPVGEIADAYNLKFPNPRYTRSAESIGRVLSRLKLQRMRVWEGKVPLRGFKHDPKKLGILYDRFLIDFEALEKAMSAATLASMASIVEWPPTSVKVIADGKKEYFHSEGVPRLHTGQSGQTGRIFMEEPAPAPVERVWQTCQHCGSPLRDPHDKMVHMEKFHSDRGVGGVPLPELPAPYLLPPSSTPEQPVKIPLETEKPVTPEKMPAEPEPKTEAPRGSSAAEQLAAMFCCELCAEKGEKFYAVSRADYESHMISCHGLTLEELRKAEKPPAPEAPSRKLVKQFRCRFPQCSGTSFETRNDLERHMILHHGAPVDELIRLQREEKWGKQESTKGEEEDEDHGNKRRRRNGVA